MRSQTAIEYLLSTNETVLFALVIILGIVAIANLVNGVLMAESHFIRRAIP